MWEKKRHGRVSAPKLSPWHSELSCCFGKSLEKIAGFWQITKPSSLLQSFAESYKPFVWGLDKVRLHS